MESLRSIQTALATNQNVAITLCDQNSLLRQLSFKDVCDIAMRIKIFLCKTIQEKDICIGLLMDKNVFIPSLILSFQELSFSFMFLTTKNFEKAAQDLCIKWVVSYQIEAVSNNYSLEDRLEIIENDFLLLLRSNDYSEERMKVCFKDIFCVMQTSGSTGVNKIVCIPHSCIEKNVLSINKHFLISNNDTIYWGTPLTFDPSLVELLLGVFNRAPLLIVPKLVALNPRYLYKGLFKVGNVSFLQMVPSVFLRWNREQISDLLLNPTIKTLALGGEPFPKEILAFKRHNNLKVFNLYGVTELSCWATVFRVPADFPNENEIPLGTCLDETFLEIHNDTGECISKGVGEICIGSSTRSCLIYNEEPVSNIRTLIKTGDVGEISGNVVTYKGRKTRTIKRLGHKISLDLIENQILQQTGLTSRFTYSSKNKKLLAFILIKEQYEEHAKIRLMDKLRVKLLNSLAEENFPDYIDVLPNFPLTSHGKISDKTLEKYYETYLETSATELVDVNKIFVHIISRYLKFDFLNDLESYESYRFLELGGNSIIAITCLSEFEKYVGPAVSERLTTLLLNEPLKEVCDYLKTERLSKRKVVEFSESKQVKKVKIKNTMEDFVIWSYDMKGCVDASPIVFNSDRTYVGVGSFAQIFALIDSNGTEYLKLNFPQDIESNIIVSKCKNYIFLGCSDGIMYCIDFSQKKVVWTFSSRDKIRSAGCLCKGFSALVFGSYDGFLYCLNIRNGNLLWKTQLLGSIRADLIKNENLKHLYVGTTKGICYSINEEDGTVIWTYEIGSPVFGAPCILNNYIVWATVSGQIHCLSTSCEPRWTHKINSNIFSSLVSHKEKLYFNCQNSFLYELTMEEEAFKITSKFQLGSEISSSPFIYEHENRTFIVTVCNVGILYVFDLKSEKKLLEYQLPGETFSSPFVFENRIYVGCRDNNLYCLNFDKALINS